MITVTNILEGDDAPDATPDWNGVQLVKTDEEGWREWEVVLRPEDAKHLFAELGNCIKAAEGAWG